MSAVTGPEPAFRQNDPGRGERPNLDVRYGVIGISAVAAALRYAGEGKNPAYAPVVQHADDRPGEFAV